MTREDIKHDLQALIEYFNDERGASPICLKECLNILSQEPCEDAISREDVINLKWQGEASEEFLEGYASAIEDARVLPPVKPQEKTGHWIGIDEEPHEVWECDHCGFVIDGSGCIDPYDYRDTYKYCPNCGAKMD